MATNKENAQAFALTNLEDDAVKLVAYTIVSLRRDHETVMEGGEGTIVVTDQMTPDAFTASIIAKYLQETKVPKAMLDKHLKYLRVYYVVSHRWPREPVEFEERQIAALQTIRNTIA